MQFMILDLSRQALMLLVNINMKKGTRDPKKTVQLKSRSSTKVQGGHFWRRNAPCPLVYPVTVAFFPGSPPSECPAVDSPSC